MERTSHLTLQGCALRLAPGESGPQAAARQWEAVFGVARSRDLLAFTNARLGFCTGPGRALRGLSLHYCRGRWTRPTRCHIEEGEGSRRLFKARNSHVRNSEAPYPHTIQKWNGQAVETMRIACSALDGTNVTTHITRQS